MIADLHCHYAMHLLPRDRHPHRQAGPWWHRIRDVLQADALDVLAHFINNPGWGWHWRVDLDGLERGGVRVVCSVLYWPYAEFDLDRVGEHSPPPEPAYFDDLKHQLGAVVQDLRAQDPNGERHVVVRPADIDDADPRIAFVHCVEGGFHLGAEPTAIKDNVKWLADNGVVYVTLAHLLPRGVAANAPAIPMLSDHLYDKVFPQEPGLGLTSLGEAAVRAMYEHGVLVDISHMRQDSIDETFAIIDDLDRQTGADPTDFPVLASHVAHRDVGPDDQAYNITDETLRRVKQRGGVVGLIFAEHQLGKTDGESESRDLLYKHIDRIEAAVGDHKLTAIGSDLDGFIKPTIDGIERAPDLAKVEEWIRDRYPADADAILYGNATRVLRRALRPSS